MKLNRSIFAIAVLLSMTVAVSFTEAHVIKKETVKTEVVLSASLSIEVVYVADLSSDLFSPEYSALAPELFTLDMPEIGNPVTDETPGAVKFRCSFRAVPRGPPKFS